MVLHYQSVSEAGTISKLIAQIHKSSGEVLRKKPRCLTKQTSGLVEIEVQRPVCMELYKDYRELGRFMLRAGGATIAAGLVTKVNQSINQSINQTIKQTIILLRFSFHPFIHLFDRLFVCCLVFFY